jgi:hypothetical protein
MKYKSRQQTPVRMPIIKKNAGKIAGKKLVTHYW